MICFLIHARVNYNNKTRHRLIVADCIVRIQRSFTTLQIELHEAVLLMMEHILTESDVSDIQHCSSTIRQISKLIKILISKGHNSCEELSWTIECPLNREDLIEKMIKKSDDIVRRGNTTFKKNILLSNYSINFDSVHLSARKLLTFHPKHRSNKNKKLNTLLKIHCFELFFKKKGTYYISIFIPPSILCPYIYIYPHLVSKISIINNLLTPDNDLCRS